MIVSSIKDPRFQSYLGVHPRLEAAFEGALELLEKNVPDGEYEIDGRNIYAMFSSYNTRTVSEAKMEIHKDYIDVQMVIEGEEIVAYESTDKLTVSTPYYPDFEFYHMNENYDKVYLCGGEFAVVFPGEAHAPSLAVNDVPSAVRKLVIKVKA